MTADAAERRPLDPPLFTGAWYRDAPLELALPAAWQVTVHWPRTPDPLDDGAVLDALRNPLGGAPLRELAAGHRRVAVIVDDLTRPTPVDRILPHLLDELAAAGIGDAAVSVVIGTGTHGPSRAGVERKVGGTVAGRVAVAFHDDRRGCVRVGTTSFGSPVVANRRVVEADLVIGVGGVYPQHSVGFGGGAKIALGALGRRSIERLHYRHPSVEGRHDVESSFRRDVAEMARMIGLKVSVVGMVDARRQLVWLRSGEPEAVFAAARGEALRMFGAPAPGDADVVIANAYPMDLSATFSRSKGVPPLQRARPGASRVLIGAASEGIGHHGLFPLVPGRAAGVGHILRVARNVPHSDLPALVGGRVRGLAARVRARAARRSAASKLPAEPAAPVIIFHPTATPAGFPASLAGMQVEPTWEGVVARITHEQAGREALAAVIYPCAPLQVLEEEA